MSGVIARCLRKARSRAELVLAWGRSHFDSPLTFRWIGTRDATRFAEQLMEGIALDPRERSGRARSLAARLRDVRRDRDLRARTAARLAFALTYFHRPLALVFRWSLESNESANFTYELTELNMKHLACFVAVVSGLEPARCRAYMDELIADGALRDHVRERTLASERRDAADPEARYGRRLGWYALARALKPALVVETGVEKGLGTCVLAAALLRNAQEGHPGRVYGTDIDPEAGFLLAGRYAEIGAILRGDSVESLRKLEGPIDLMVNDSDHSEAYEALEYRTVAAKLAPAAVIVGDNAHITQALHDFAEETGRRFLYFQERPRDHWYSGAGMGVAFPATPPPPPASRRSAP